MSETIAWRQFALPEGTRKEYGRVVLVEDDDAMRELLATTLRMHGYYVRTAADGVSAMRLLEITEPEVIVLDMGLPMASGFEVLHEVRSSARTRRTPVIAISGLERAVDLARVNPDVFATLAKPFHPDDLVRAVFHAMNRRVGGAPAAI